MTTGQTHIGEYKVIAKIGQGGMAEVLLALKPGPAGFRKLLVIKQLRAELVADEQYLTMFLDEARLAARLAHNNVVRTYEVGQHEASYYIAMDYLEGQSFNRVLSRSASLPLPARIRIVSEVLAGLEYAHNLKDFDGSPLNVIHRDVSPHNVFVTYNGGVQLLDFGIAKAAGASSQTREGTFKGKVSYIAPEQAQAGAVDRRADIFSVGVMLWEAVAGKRLSRGDQDLVRLRARIDGTEPRLRDVAPDADPLLLDACDQAMALDPDERFQSAEAFRKALQPFLAKTSPTSQELAAWMDETFAKEREALATKIEEQVRRHEESQSQEIPILDVGTSSRTPLTGSVPAQPVRAKGRWAMIATVGVALVVGVAVATIGPDSEDSPATPLVDAPPVATQSEPDPAPVEAVATTFELRLEAFPAESEIYLDGERLDSNPFHRTVTQDDTEHRLRISAPGFRDHEQTVSFDRDHVIGVRLVEERQPRTASMRTRMRPDRDSPPAEMIEAMVEATMVPEPVEAVMTQTQMMSAEMTGGPRPIDETDPY